MRKKWQTTLLFVLIIGFSPTNLTAADGVLRFGFNLPLTGMFELIGSSSKNAAELVRKSVVQAGGLQVGEKLYDIDFLYGDNQSNPIKASQLTVEQISRQRILGMIGPLSSRQSIPVGMMANSFSTPMISPWSTSSEVTKGRDYVFRGCFVFSDQSPVLTKFAANEFNATKAAVLYDKISAYPRRMANSFKKAFESINGSGSVVAFEQFQTGDEDFSKQLVRIKNSGAEFIFTPQHYNEVPLIIRQTKAMGLSIPVMGSNSWAGGDLVGECGDDCNDLFFTGNYAPGNAQGMNKEFVKLYVETYKQMPDEPAALTWDSVQIMLQAVREMGYVSFDLIDDRKRLKDSLATITNFKGVTGEMSFDGTGNPRKCVMVVKISEGMFTHHSSICP